jgi:hypothetical protein
MSQVSYFVCLSLSLLSPYPSCLRTLPFAPQARASLQSSLLASSALSGFALSSLYISGETDLNPIGAMGKVSVSLNVRRVFATCEQYDPSPSGHTAGVCAGGSWQHDVESHGCSYQRCRREPSGGHDAGARHAVPVLTPGVTQFGRTSKPGCFSGSLRNSSFSRSLWEFSLGWPSQYPHTCFFHQRMSSAAMRCPPPQRSRG